MTAQSVARPAARRSVAAHAVVALTLIVAVLGAFPHQLLFVFPLAAALTLAGVDRRVRYAVVLVSALALGVGLLQWAGVG